jgi:hypothetical protein
MRSGSTTLPVQTSNQKARGIRIIANSLFRELVSQGYSQSHVISLTSELLGLITTSMRSARSQAAPETDP